MCLAQWPLLLKSTTKNAKYFSGMMKEFCKFILVGNLITVVLRGTIDRKQVLGVLRLESGTNKFKSFGKFCKFLLVDNLIIVDVGSMIRNSFFWYFC